MFLNTTRMLLGKIAWISEQLNVMKFRYLERCSIHDKDLMRLSKCSTIVEYVIKDLIHHVYHAFLWYWALLENYNPIHWWSDPNIFCAFPRGLVICWWHLSSKLLSWQASVVRRYRRSMFVHPWDRPFFLGVHNLLALEFFPPLWNHIIVM